MKTRKEKKTASLASKVVKGLRILKVKELLQIRGGNDGAPTQKDSEID